MLPFRAIVQILEFGLLEFVKSSKLEPVIATRWQCCSTAGTSRVWKCFCCLGTSLCSTMVSRAPIHCSRCTIGRTFLNWNKQTLFWSCYGSHLCLFFFTPSKCSAGQFQVLILFYEAWPIPRIICNVKRQRLWVLQDFALVLILCLAEDTLKDNPLSVLCFSIKAVPFLIHSCSFFGLSEHNSSQIHPILNSAPQIFFHSAVNYSTRKVQPDSSCIFPLKELLLPIQICYADRFLPLHQILNTIWQ